MLSREYFRKAIREVTIWDAIETGAFPFLAWMFLELCAQIVGSPAWRTRLRARRIQIAGLRAKPGSDDALSFMDSYLEAWIVLEARQARFDSRVQRYVPLAFLMVVNLPVFILRIFIAKWRADARRTRSRLDVLTVIAWRAISLGVSFRLALRFVATILAGFDGNGGPLLGRLAGWDAEPVDRLDVMRREHDRCLAVLQGEDPWILLLRTFTLPQPFKAAESIQRATGRKIVMLADPSLRDFLRLKVQDPDQLYYGSTRVTEDPRFKNITRIEDGLPAGVHLMFAAQDQWVKAVGTLISHASAIVILNGRLTRGLRRELRLIKQANAWNKCARAPFSTLLSDKFFVHLIPRQVVGIAEFKTIEDLNDIMQVVFDAGPAGQPSEHRSGKVKQ